MALFSFFLYMLFLAGIVAEVTILTKRQTIYDRSPKVRIKGSGMDMKADDIRLEIGALDQDPLILNKDFIIGKDEDGEGVILKLLSNRR